MDVSIYYQYCLIDCIRSLKIDMATECLKSKLIKPIVFFRWIVNLTI